MEEIKANTDVYVIKYKYKNKKLIYYILKMYCTGIRGAYIYCRAYDNKDKYKETPFLYAQTFSRHRNRVFNTFEEAEKQRQYNQKEHDIKKELEVELKIRMEKE